MKTQSVGWTQLENQDDRKVAHIAAIARIDTIHGGARALTIARHCSKWDAESVVSDVYSRSTGKHSQQFEAWECPECGQTHLGIEAAESCCAFSEEYDDACEVEELGVSDDNWACGTLDVET
jgi:rubrerythrin